MTTNIFFQLVIGGARSFSSVEVNAIGKSRRMPLNQGLGVKGANFCIS